MAVPDRGTRWAIAALAVGGCLVASSAGCASEHHQPPQETIRAVTPSTSPARLTLADNPIQLAADLIHDEQQLRNPAAAPDLVAAATRREQLAYRAISRHAEWSEVIRPRIPAELLDGYDRNISARRNLNQLAPVVDTLPAWRIVPTASPDELLAYYREAEAQTGVGWNYLAAINLIETGFGRIAATSTAGAQGPMQFLPTTFAAYGNGGDIHSARDSILAAGRYLASSGFADDPDRAIFQYNHADEYVAAVTQYAAIMAADSAAFGVYHRWNVYYFTTAGDVLLPEGYSESSRIPAQTYLATHPQ